MNLPETSQQQLLQTRFALEQAQTFSLEQKLHSRENKDDLMKAAKQFEGVFVKMVMAEMDKTIERNDFLSGGPAEEVFRGLLYDNIAEQIATRPMGSGFGLAEAIYNELSRHLPKDQQETGKTTEVESGGTSHD